MQLKSIEIKGFKSFADKTKFVFSEGLVAIVGPNGCGKSNVVEAFRWALSSDSARSLRAQKMEDVIFSGTQKRLPQNIAEVSVSFADPEGFFALPFQEITITKKLVRGGDSQLYLNKSPIRSLDLKELFSSTGVLKNAFALFEQGSVDRLIRLSPIERRPFFEEVAGIGLFLEKKKASLQKLREAEENIQRVYDLKKELENRLSLLEKQKQKCEEYQFFKQDALNWQRLYLIAVWKHVKESFFKEKSALDTARKQLLSLQKEEQEALEKMSLQENLLKTATDKLMVCLQEEAKISSELRYREKERASVEKELLSLTQEEQRKTAFILKDQKLLDEIACKIQSSEASFHQGKALLEKLIASEQEKRADFFTFSSLLKECLSQESQKKELLSEIKMQLRQAVWQEGQFKSTFSEQQKLYEEKNQEQQLLASSLQDKQLFLNACNSHLSCLEFFLQNALRLQKNCSVFLQRIQEKLGAKSSFIEEQKEKYASLEGKKNLLLQLFESYEGYQEGAKALLTAARSPGHMLFKKVCTFAEEVKEIADQKLYSLASLQIFDQVLVVKSKEEMKCVLNYAETEGLKGFSLICKEEFSSSLLVVPSWDFAEKKIEEEKEIALWCYIEKLQVHLAPFKMAISLGTQESSHLERQEQLRVCSKELEALNTCLNEQIFQKNSLSSLEASFSSAKEASSLLLQGIEQKKSALSVEIKQARFAIESLENSLNLVVSKTSSIKKRLDELLLEKSSLGKTIDELSVRVSKEEQAYEVLFQEKISFEEKAKALGAGLEEIKEKLRKQELAHIQDKHLLQDMQRQENQLKENVQRAKVHAQQLQKTLFLKSKELAEFLKEKPSSDGKMELVKSQGLSLKKEKETLESSLQFLRGKEQHLRKESKELQNHLHSLQSSSDQLLREKKEIETSFFDQFGHLLSDSCVAAKEEDPNFLEKKWVEAKKMQERLEGSVNMLALEEFNELSARVLELSDQLEDLLEAKKHLLFAIDQLDEKSRAAFEDTFLQVRSCFKKNFSLLFEGGEADLHLVGQKDLLQAGIEVVARPPGKSFRPLTLLSGGERCLTSIALLMAFFNSKAAPFCVLDEIDAPLDEANVERFLHLIKAYSEKCQFILVTHNKKTMEACTLLYGISMQERGISKAVSLRLEEDKRPILDLAERPL